jgi:V/A-type H+-transporting ATPase subunit F
MSSNQGNLKMAAVGDYESILPFQAVGIDPFVAERNGESDDQDIQTLLRRLMREKYAVVFLVDSLFKGHQGFIRELNENYPISIIPVPGVRGSTGIGVEAIRESVERAVGMDIFSVE